MMLSWKCRSTAYVCVLACVGPGLRTQLVFMCTQLYSCICRWVLEVLHTWEWTYVCGVLSASMGFDPYMWDAWQKPCSAYFYSPFNRFTSICNSNTHSWHFCIRLSLYDLMYLHSCTKTPYFLNFTQIMNLTTFSFFAIINLLCWQRKDK